jgi:nicotinamide-nucleotide amidase
VTFAPASLALATRVLEACQARGFRLATAESCTGGLIAACLTEIAGSSSVVERGYVTYDNRAKQEMLGVPLDLLQRVGAVSEEVALAMAAGARARAGVELAIAVTGIAGPGGATATKPVGLVHIALAAADAPGRHERHLFTGDRSAVRRASLDAALALILRSVA